MMRRNICARILQRCGAVLILLAGSIRLVGGPFLGSEQDGQRLILRLTKSANRAVINSTIASASQL
jgi:hypothetical protein